ncbi:MAG: LysR family transcriptional regulator, partial [Alphaproteobacteria bacterium]
MGFRGPPRKQELLPDPLGNLLVDRRRLPPLNALRAFEAAARHLNFSRAADELSVTPGAVSQQIQNLEDYIGAALFKRTPKG